MSTSISLTKFLPECYLLQFIDHWVEPMQYFRRSFLAQNDVFVHIKVPAGTLVHIKDTKGCIFTLMIVMEFHSEAESNILLGMKILFCSNIF